MSDPRTIVIDSKGDSRHLEITVGATEHDLPVDQIIDGYRWVAGIVARLALHLASDLEDTARRHGCQPSQVGYWCGLSAPDSVINPGLDLGDPPAAWICVPTDQSDLWLDYIRHTLASLITGDLQHAGSDVVQLHPRPQPGSEVTG